MPAGVESPRRRRALGSPVRGAGMPTRRRTRPGRQDGAAEAGAIRGARDASPLIADSSVSATIRYMEIVETSASAVEIRAHLDRLFQEWRQAESAGLGLLGPYIADLAAEIAACRVAFVATAVSEIAVLRGELFGIQVG